MTKPVVLTNLDPSYKYLSDFQSKLYSNKITKTELSKKKKDFSNYQNSMKNT